MFTSWDVIVFSCSVLYFFVFNFWGNSMKRGIGVYVYLSNTHAHTHTHNARRKKKLVR